MWFYIFCLGYYIIGLFKLHLSAGDLLAKILASIVGLTALLIWFCLRRGEKLRWRWGDKDDTNPPQA